jgi:hypothetical protein
MIMLVTKLLINIRRSSCNVPAFCAISQKFLPAGTELFHGDSQVDRRTDERTYDTKLPVAFPNFENAPKKFQPPALKTFFSGM